MSLDYDRRQLEAKQKAQADTLKKAATLRTSESRKRSDSAKADEAAARTKSASTARMKKQEAVRALDAANKYGKEASALEVKAAGYAAEAARLQAKIAKGEADESQRVARKHALAQRAAEQAQRAARAEQRGIIEQIASTHERVMMTEVKAEQALRALSAPKAEKLRILMLGASPQGDLRITREHTRIRKAVEAAAHRDLVEFDVRLSATAQDLQEGIARFRPHVVHFAGHGDDQLISFEDDVDDFHDGIVVTASAFASACEATDQPPTLIVFNACQSSGTADALVERFAPLAIGMTDSIDDSDALTYATALYSSIANGHSVRSAHLAGRAAIELVGGEHELPYLTFGPEIDPSLVMLVKQSPES